MSERANVRRAGVTAVTLVVAFVAATFGCSEREPTGLPDADNRGGDDTSEALDADTSEVSPPTVWGDASDSGDAPETGGSGDTSEPPMDTGSTGVDTAVACGSVDGQAGSNYLKVEADAEQRRPCNDVCGDVCLACDGNYDHPDFAFVAYVAEYGPIESTYRTAGSSCAAPPAETETDLDGNEQDLRTYTCYCKPEN